MKGLSFDEITALQAKGTGRNKYGPKVVELVNSDEAAVSVRDNWIEFKDTSPEALYQGFSSAIKKADLEDTIEVRKLDQDVYLLHKERIALMQNGDDETEVENQTNGSVELVNA